MLTQHLGFLRYQESQAFSLKAKNARFLASTAGIGNTP